MRSIYSYLILIASCFFSSCEKEDLNAEALKKLNGTWVSTKVLWYGIDQTFATDYTFIFSGTNSYTVSEDASFFGRFQDKGTVEVTDDGAFIDFTSEVNKPNWSAKIIELGSNTMTLEYARTYFDFNGNQTDHSIKTTFQKQ